LAPTKAARLSSSFGSERVHRIKVERDIALGHRNVATLADQTRLLHDKVLRALIVLDVVLVFLVTLILPNFVIVFHALVAFSFHFISDSSVLGPGPPSESTSRLGLRTGSP
jgi:hypothetical protein